MDERYIVVEGVLVSENPSTYQLVFPGFGDQVPGADHWFYFPPEEEKNIDGGKIYFTDR